MKTEKPQPLDLEEFRKSWKSVDIDMTIPDDFWDEFKQHIKSACEFYLRYKDHPGLLKDEAIKNRYILQISVKKIEQFLHKISESYSRNGDTEYWFDKYNNWLFKLAFKDVLKEE